MVTVEEAIKILEQAVLPLQESVQLPILEAEGRVVAEDIYAPVNVPHFPKSAMDGYALMSGDIAGASRKKPARLRVIGELWPGDTTSYTAGSGTAVRIMTGGALPAGYDCVVKQEDTDYGEATVAVYAPVAHHGNYCAVGEDIKKGELVITRHTRLTCQHIGILAGMGLPYVTVLRPLRVGIIATGNEVIQPGTPLGAAQVYNSSSYTIATHLKSAGVEVPLLSICGDDSEGFCRMVQKWNDQVDVLLTTGAVSVGKSDFIPAAIQHLGAELLFHRVQMKPGTPVLAASYQNKLLLCFSGNPFAALVNFHLFFWPVLAKAMQNPSLSWRHTQAVLREGDMKPSQQRRLIRAHARDGGVYFYSRDHRSSVISNLTALNCMVDQPPQTPLREGDTVEIILW